MKMNPVERLLERGLSIVFLLCGLACSAFALPVLDDNAACSGCLSAAISWVGANREHPDAFAPHAYYTDDENYYVVLEWKDGGLWGFYQKQERAIFEISRGFSVKRVITNEELAEIDFAYQRESKLREEERKRQAEEMAREEARSRIQDYVTDTITGDQTWLLSVFSPLGYREAKVELFSLECGDMGAPFSARFRLSWRGMISKLTYSISGVYRRDAGGETSVKLDPVPALLIDVLSLTPNYPRQNLRAYAAGGFVLNKPR